MIRYLKTNVTELAQQYNRLLCTVIDLRALLVTKRPLPYFLADG